MFWGLSGKGREEEERMEIQRIMKELTEFLRKYHGPISSYNQLVVNLDLLLAKAKLAVKMNAALPAVDARTIV